MHSSHYCSNDIPRRCHQPTLWNNACTYMLTPLQECINIKLEITLPWSQVHT
eukprot:c27925_g2_i1 orf=23-178(-)